MRRRKSLSVLTIVLIIVVSSAYNRHDAPLLDACVSAVRDNDFEGAATQLVDLINNSAASHNALAWHRLSCAWRALGRSAQAGAAAERATAFSCGTRRTGGMCFDEHEWCNLCSLSQLRMDDMRRRAAVEQLATQHQLATKGYVVLRSAINASLLAATRLRLERVLTKREQHVRVLRSQGQPGSFVMHFPLEPELDFIAEMMAQPSIVAAYRTVLGTAAFAHSAVVALDVPTQPVHRDHLQDSKGSLILSDQFEPTQNGDSFAVYKFATYLHDSVDHGGLVVLPSSHLEDLPPRPGEPWDELRTRLGDVVVFDTRLWHGRNVQGVGQPASLVQWVVGARGSAFTDELADGYVVQHMRNRAQTALEYGVRPVYAQLFERTQLSYNWRLREHL